jgi:sec-independent protein translocase protein TatA
MAMFGLGTTELIVIGAIVFLIFGAKRIPEIGKGLGGAVREFRQIKKDITHDEEAESEGEKEEKETKNDPPSLENKLTEKVIEQAPGVKKVMDAKKKVDKVKNILKS